MKLKIKRQGLCVSIKELKDLVKELQEFNWEKGSFKKEFEKINYFQVNIINKEGLSDTWRLE